MNNVYVNIYIEIWPECAMYWPWQTTHKYSCSIPVDYTKRFHLIYLLMLVLIGLLQLISIGIIIYIDWYHLD